MSVTFEIPVKLVSEMNSRDHWAKRHRRFKAQGKWVLASLIGKNHPTSERIAIVLTRLKAPRQRNFDGDNLQASFKAIRDAIAAWLDIDDGSDRLHWEYRQDKGEKAGVRVEIRGME